MSRLDLIGLGKTYGTVHVVKGVDLSLRDGEFVSLLGPSGCGKTTTLRMIAGFVEPTAGTITLDGAILSTPGSVVPPERRGMSMIFQSYAIWPNMTVAENVAFGLKVRQAPRAEVERRVGEILQVVRLTHLAGRYPAELSGGQQQRVALARAVVVKPAVLLLDEPLSNLDANLRDEMRIEIRRLHDEFRCTTVYVTHDQGEAMAASDRIAVMNAGRIEQLDAPHVLYTRPASRFVANFVGRTNLLEATWDAEAVSFQGFTLTPAPLGLPADRGTGTFSIRPQSMTISTTKPGLEHPSVSARIAARVYLGEVWDYTVAVGDAGLTLRVTASPMDVYEVGAEVWLGFDVRQMPLIASA